MDDNQRWKNYLDRFMTKGKATEGMKAVPVFEAWSAIAGDLASHCVLRDLEAGSLLVDVDHPGWMQMFQMRETEILRSLKRRFPQLHIQTIRLRLVESLQAWQPGALDPHKEPAFAETQPIPEEKILPKTEITDENLAKLLKSFDDLSSQKS